MKPGNFVKRGSVKTVSIVITGVPSELKERAVRGSGRWFQGFVLRNKTLWGLSPEKPRLVIEANLLRKEMISLR